MNIATLQYVHFIQKKFPQHELKIVHVSQLIKKLEKDEKAFEEIIDEVRSSNGVLWSFGLLVLAVPSQYMRFIELISERGVEDAFENKYAAVLSTSEAASQFKITTKRSSDRGLWRIAAHHADFSKVAICT